MTRKQLNENEVKKMFEDYQKAYDDGIKEEDVKPTLEDFTKYLNEKINNAPNEVKVPSC